MSENATSRTVAQGMARLKELLFDSEVETLSELDKRLGSIEHVNRQHEHQNFETLQRLDQLFNRAGTEERFRTSVAAVLDKALEEAEFRNHDQMSRAIAPLVVNTIRTELRNSQDELVDIMFRGADLGQGIVENGEVTFEIPEELSVPADDATHGATFTITRVVNASMSKSVPAALDLIKAVLEALK